MREIFQTVITLTLCFGAAGMTSGKSLHAEEPSTDALGAWVKEQVEDGRLVLEFYDPAKPPRPFPGWTEFEFRLDYKYEFRTEFPKPRKGIQTAIVLPTFTKVDFNVKQKIQLPRTLQSPRWFAAGLGRHELDHVRIGQHPRLAMLSQQLIRTIQRSEATIQTKSEVDAKWVNSRLEAEISPRQKAIYDLVHAINKKLDALSNHGANPLPGREEFMEGLYLKECLDEMKFPYLAEVLELANSREFQKARIQFREPELEKQPQ